MYTYHYVWQSLPLSRWPVLWGFSALPRCWMWIPGAWLLAPRSGGSGDQYCHHLVYHHRPHPRPPKPLVSLKYILRISTSDHETHLPINPFEPIIPKKFWWYFDFRDQSIFWKYLNTSIWAYNAQIVLVIFWFSWPQHFSGNIWIFQRFRTRPTILFQIGM